MRSIRSIFYLMATVVVVSCCSPSSDSDLHRLNLNGQVKTLEIITQTPIPISEWLYAERQFGSFETVINPALCYSFIGNSSMRFNRSGNIKDNTVYDNNGKKLGYSRSVRRTLELYEPFAIDVNEMYSVVSKQRDEKNRVVEELYTEKGYDRYRRIISYNEKGDINEVTCNYILLTFEALGHKIEFSDTVRIHYTEYDGHDNWTKATFVFDGVGKRNDFTMDVVRQITYRGEKKYPLLIDQLNRMNVTERDSFVQLPVKYERVIPARNGLSIELPSNMAYEGQPFPDSNLYQYSANNTTGYFSFSLQYSDSAENLIESFDATTDESFEQAMRLSLESMGIQVLSWIGSGKTIINGRNGIWLSYYHYPTGGLGGTPVKVEMYHFQSPATGIIATLTFGYDSAHDYEYKQQVEHMKESIHFK